MIIYIFKYRNYKKKIVIKQCILYLEICFFYIYFDDKFQKVKYNKIVY